MKLKTFIASIIIILLIIVMNNVFYYLIFAIILYFVLSRVFEKFSIEQENFDPSLVPVSSIVTLAKVAQKLVDGNGTLSNPGNLQVLGNVITNSNYQLNDRLAPTNKKYISLYSWIVPFKKRMQYFKNIYIIIVPPNKLAMIILPL
jgi:hypothetical protein